MSAKLFFSNSPTILLNKLSENLEWSDPFLSPHISTPTPALKRWVQMRLAEKRGIVANVDFMQLEKTLWGRLEKLDAEHIVDFRKPARILDEQGLQLLILGLLQNKPPPEVKEYLGWQNDKPNLLATSAKRLCQLSQKLAELFREYEYNRVREHGHNGLAYAWKRGENCFLPYFKKNTYNNIRSRVEKIESWQRDIYYELFKVDGYRDQLGKNSGQYRYTLPQYAEMVLDQPKTSTGENNISTNYHLFGLSQVSAFHRSLINRLADNGLLQNRAANFYIYSLNPCAEYWEDAFTPQEKRSREKKSAAPDHFSIWRILPPEKKIELELTEDELSAEVLAPKTLTSKAFNSETLTSKKNTEKSEIDLDENPPLSLWGKPGRENIQLWCQMTEYEFYEQFKEPDSLSLLGKMQTAILHRQGLIFNQEKELQDDSIQIFSCPEIHREVETVYDGIVKALNHDSTLRPDEIAILVPNMQDYQFALTSVFKRMEAGQPGYIPINISEVSIATESDYAKGLKLLFCLILGKLSRKDFISLAKNPCFQKQIGIDEQTIGAWEAWSKQLHIYHGFDGKDKQSHGYVDEDIHTWNHGVESLILGTIMESPAEGDYRNFQGLIPYSNGSSANRDLLQSFVKTICDLHEGLTPFRNQHKRTWNEWIQLLHDLIEKYLSPIPNNRVEYFLQLEIKQYFNEVKELDQFSNFIDGSVQNSKTVSIHLLIELILAKLEATKINVEPPLSGGINVASLSAMRSLPFKMVYVLGLGEGKFPDHEESSTLDLRQYRRIIGEVSPSARNRYLFLETLMCAKEKICFSYVSRDLEKGKDLLMCSVLTELKEYLETYFLSDQFARQQFKITPVPLLAPQVKIHASEKLDGTGFNITSPKNNTIESENFFLEEIRLFLENPIEYTLRKKFLIRETGYLDNSEDENEPFTSNHPVDYQLFENTFNEKIESIEIESNVSILKNLIQNYENRSLRGETPEGLYKDFDRQNIQNQATEFLTTLDELKNQLYKNFQKLKWEFGVTVGEKNSSQFSRFSRLSKTTLATDAVTINVETHTVKLNGYLSNLFCAEGHSGCGTVVFFPGKFKAKNLLKPFLFYLLGICLPEENELRKKMESGPFTIYSIAPKKTSETKAYEILSWEPFLIHPQEAQIYLQNLMAAILTGNDFDLLPFSIIEKKLTKDFKLLKNLDYRQELLDAIEEIEDLNSDYPIYNPTETISLIDPKIPEDAGIKIQQRFSLFFNS